uniref:Uncharacterized protein n=1 Tax=Rhizophora mucronata TaxID=61149 RepID=A0A2P2IKH5_RHIMU
MFEPVTWLNFHIETWTLNFFCSAPLT